MGKYFVLLAALAMTLQSVAAEKTCYSGYRLKGQEHLPPCDESIKAASAEELIQKAIVSEVGEQVKYKGSFSRVISVKLTEQVVGPHKGKSLADIEFIVDPDMMKNVSKDGAMIDIQRFLKRLSEEDHFKKSNVALFMIRPYVVDPSGKLQQILKVEFNKTDLLKLDWRVAGAQALEAAIVSKGKLKPSPYLLQNGGQHLVLNKDHLGI